MYICIILYISITLVYLTECSYCYLCLNIFSSCVVLILKMFYRKGSTFKFKEYAVCLMITQGIISVQDELQVEYLYSATIIQW